jgi:predicted ATPase
LLPAHNKKDTYSGVFTVARQRPGSGIISYGDVGHGAFSMMLFTLFYENDPYVSQEDTMLFQ